MKWVSLRWVSGEEDLRQDRGHVVVGKAEEDSGTPLALPGPDCRYVRVEVVAPIRGRAALAWRVPGRPVDPLHHKLRVGAVVAVNRLQVHQVAMFLAP